MEFNEAVMSEDMLAQMNWCETSSTREANPGSEDAKIKEEERAEHVEGNVTMLEPDRRSSCVGGRLWFRQ